MMADQEQFAPITEATPIRFSDQPPKPSEAVDLVVIGGGVIGVFTALYARRLGLSVTLLEKGRIAGEQSSRNWGWIRQQGRDWAELPIMIRSRQLWHTAHQETGRATGLKQAGVYYFARNESELADYENWIELAALHDVESRILSKSQMDTLFNGQAPPGFWKGGLVTPSDCRAEPWQAVPAVAKLAEQEGVNIIENCAVRLLDLEGGKIAGVITEKGRIRASQVVLAGGAWSSLLARIHGVTIPQLSVRGSVARTQKLPPVFEGAGCDDALGIRRREDGGYSLALVDRHDFMLGPDAFRHALSYLPLYKTAWKHIGLKPAQGRDYPDGWGTARAWQGDELSPFERIRVLNPKPCPKQVNLMAERFAERFPHIGKPKMTTSWAGMIDCMPDVVPIVDHVEQLPGLIIATGMSAHGFGIGPGYGEVIAKMAAGQPTDFDLTRFRLSRFSDGSKLELGPEL